MGTADRGSPAAVLIGSGASLNAVDVGRLRGRQSISFNRAWIGWRRWGFIPTWYACFDPASFKIVAPDMTQILSFAELETIYLPSCARGQPGLGDPRIEYVTLVEGKTFGSESDVLTDYGNAGATTLQIMYHRGLRKVLLVGVDGAYDPHATVGADTSHFEAAYARAPQPADMSRYVVGWPAALAESKKRGVQVRNASPGSRVEGCASIDFEAGLRWLTE
jgi:hypothetical protein